MLRPSKLFRRKRPPLQPLNPNGETVKILFITDAWLPQVNGVVRTLQTTAKELERRGHEVFFIGPSDFHTVSLPTYKEIRVAVFPSRKLSRMIREIAPDAIHIPTEGPLGWAARNICLKKGYEFTTSYHTRFPEYIRERMPVPVDATYWVLKQFHRPSASVMVATPTIERELSARGFTNLRRWSRGVDTTHFRPRPECRDPQKPFLEGEAPFLLYAGRVAVEKNIEAFLQADVKGTKYVVGDGPMLEKLKKTYPEVHFTGAKHGEELAQYFAAADVFVFPSKTDTFGLVILEALASGVPVAAFPVPGPNDVIGNSGIGVLNDDLSIAIEEALKIDREACRNYAMQFSWEASVNQFISSLHPFPSELHDVAEEEGFPLNLADFFATAINPHLAKISIPPQDLPPQSPPEENLEKPSSAEDSPHIPEENPDTKTSDTP